MRNVQCENKPWIAAIHIDKNVVVEWQDWSPNNSVYKNTLPSGTSWNITKRLLSVNIPLPNILILFSFIY